MDDGHCGFGVGRWSPRRPFCGPAWEAAMRWVGLFALIFGGVSAAQAQSFTPDPVDKAAAVKEGTLTWYSSTPFPLVQQLADRFTKDTGVKVTLLRSGG